MTATKKTAATKSEPSAAAVAKAIGEHRVIYDFSDEAQRLEAVKVVLAAVKR